MAKLKRTTFVSGKYKGQNLYSKFWAQELHGREPVKIDGFTFLFRHESPGKTIDGLPVNTGTDYYQKD